MLSQEKLDLQNYRLSTAKEKIDTGKILIENKLYKDCVNRSYYAIFKDNKLSLI